MEDKAKAYVKRKKEEQMAAIRSSLGDAINAANRRKMAAPYLQSEEGGTFLAQVTGECLK